MRRVVVLSASLLCLGVTHAQVPVTDADTNALVKRVSTLERVVDAKRAGQHNMQTQLESVQDEVDELRGTLETHSHKLEQILERQRELYSEIDKLVSVTVNQNSNVVAIPSSPQNNSVEIDSPAVIQTPLAIDPKEMYQSAVDLVIKDKRYDEAVPAFEAFLAAHPDSTYVPNAHYWLGQLKFNRRDWQASQNHFSVVVNQYPDSNKRPASMLKLGDALVNLGNVAKAQETFEALQVEYPDSSAKKIADSRLRKLKQKN